MSTVGPLVEAGLTFADDQVDEVLGKHRMALMKTEINDRSKGWFALGSMPSETLSQWVEQHLQTVAPPAAATIPSLSELDRQLTLFVWQLPGIRRAILTMLRLTLSSPARPMHSNRLLAITLRSCGIAWKP